MFKDLLCKCKFSHERYSDYLTHEIKTSYVYPCWLSESMFDEFLHGNLTIIVHNDEEYKLFLSKGYYYRLCWMDGTKIVNDSHSIYTDVLYPFSIKCHSNRCDIYVCNNQQCVCSITSTEKYNDYSVVNYIRGI
jgi:hypothetical protein